MPLLRISTPDENVLLRRLIRHVATSYEVDVELTVDCRMSPTYELVDELDEGPRPLEDGSGMLRAVTSSVSPRLVLNAQF